MSVLPIEASERLVFLFVGIKDGQQFCDYQQVFDFAQ